MARQAEAENIGRLGAIDRRIKEIDNELTVKFPDYAALASPTPLAVQEVQTLLGADEALVLFLDTEEWKPTPKETFIWVVTKLTKRDMRWVRSGLGTKPLRARCKRCAAGSMRCGAWHTKARRRSR